MRRLAVVGWLLGGLGAACGSKLDPNALSTAATGDGGLGGGGDGGDGGSSTPFDATADVDAETPPDCTNVHESEVFVDNFESDIMQWTPARKDWEASSETYTFPPAGGVTFEPGGYIERKVFFCEEATLMVRFLYDSMPASPLGVGIVQLTFGPAGSMNFGFDSSKIIISDVGELATGFQDITAKKEHKLKVTHGRDNVVFSIDEGQEVTYTFPSVPQYKLRVGAVMRDATTQVTITSVQIETR